jgi:hypothetical protein
MIPNFCKKLIWLIGCILVACTIQHPAQGDSPAASRPELRLGHQRSQLDVPALSIDPYVRPSFAARMLDLRPTIEEAAARHNRPDLSGMSNTEFAAVIALLLYNEHFGWLEDDIPPLRMFTPLYQHSQVALNQSGIGSNFSVWPANLRPSVALEILRQQLPVPDSTKMMTVPVTVAGSEIVPAHYPSQRALFAAITQEISQDELAVEYLAANLERGLYRASYEGVPISWRTLAGWHNQGIVRPQQIRANAYASDYVRRTSAYLPQAHCLMSGPQAIQNPCQQWDRGMERWFHSSVWLCSWFCF